MNSRERVLCTIDHKEPDRVPVDFGATMETGIHQDAYHKLKEKLGLCLDKPDVEMLKTAGFARVNEELQRYIGADVRGVFPYPANRDSIEYRNEGNYTYFNDEFGILWRKALKGGLYFDICAHPLAGKSLEEIRAFPFPDPADDRRFAHIQEYLNQVDLKIQFWDVVLDRYGDRIDVVKELDDMGTQLNLWISPEMYQDLIKPRLVKLIRFIKSKKPHVKMMMHSCGSVFTISSARAPIHS